MPDMKIHDEFIEWIDDQLSVLGFGKSIAVGYHNIMSKETVNSLQSRYDPTSLYLRGRTDRLSIHNEKILTLIWDGKLHESEKWNDCCIEFYQFRTYLCLSVNCQVKFLYIYYNRFEKLVKSFEPHNIDIREIKVPKRYESYYDDIKNSVENHFWIDKNIVSLSNNSYYGSNDPFIIIDHSTIKDLPDWKYLIGKMIEEAPGLNEPLVI